jgi:hypothetical protein
MTQYHSEDRPDPAEQPIRARVPDQVAAGAFSTGVIVMTAHSEFVLDFVQNLGRPHQIVARVIMPHHVLPQLVDALQRNMELYRNRWGELPHTGAANVQWPTSGVTPGSGEAKPAGEAAPAAGVTPGASDSPGKSGEQVTSHPPAPQTERPGTPTNTGAGPASGAGARQPSVQDIYDDLKIRDEFLSGAYANAVMIGHGPHEFSFDFITNFYPHSAVSSRVFLAAGQIPRLYDSLKSTWEQIRIRMQTPGKQPPPSTEGPPEDPPTDRPNDEPFA